MIELQGKYNTAKVFTDNADQKTIGQIIELCNQEFTKDSKIRIMPDCHFGAGSTIGTTMTILDKVVPNLVGVDVGCGVSYTEIKIDKDTISFDELDSKIRNFVPSGQSVHESNKKHDFSKQINFDAIRAPFDISRAQNAMGTLGGGNHFIELNQINENTVALVIHSGSRNLGAQVAKHYQNVAYDELTNTYAEKDAIIQKLKREGRTKEIQAELKKIKVPQISRDLAYLQGNRFDDYMHDMKIAQHYAMLNRKAMADIIVKQMNWTVVDSFDTIHNYIDLDSMIMRKGAISAQKDERVIIPINMRDGSIIATGKGNPDWNFSGPHGAGRVLSRSKARELVDFNDFESTMKDVWSTSVSQSTVDESPMAYKPINEILRNITDSVEIQQVIKPLYNFKV